MCGEAALFELGVTSTGCVGGRVSGVQNEGESSVGDSKTRASPGLLSTGNEAGRLAAVGVKGADVEAVW